MNNNKDKVSFFWVLVVFMVTISVAYANIGVAKTVQQYNQELDLQQQQSNLDFPVLEHWSAGNGEDAYWVNPDQSLSPIGLNGVYLDTPNYKLHTNSVQPETNVTDYKHIYRSVAKIKLLEW